MLWRALSRRGSHVPRGIIIMIIQWVIKNYLVPLYRCIRIYKYNSHWRIATGCYRPLWISRWNPVDVFCIQQKRGPLRRPVLLTGPFWTSCHVRLRQKQSVYIYIYIYFYVCVCVCGCLEGCTIIYKNERKTMCEFCDWLVGSRRVCVFVLFLNGVKTKKPTWLKTKNV